MFEMEILQSIIEQEGVRAHFADGVEPAFDAIFVDEDDDVLQIVRQHVGLVARGQRIEQERFAIGNNARRRRSRRRSAAIKRRFVGRGTLL